MSLHRVEFDYDLPEGGFLEMDLDPKMDLETQEMIAEREIKDSFPDALNIEIVNIEEV
jgi:hypothetical protein